MNDLIIASSPEDALAFEAVENHHAELNGALVQRVNALVTAVDSGGDALAARDALVEWCDRELVPHALAEEKAMYPAGQARPELRALVDAMLAEHTVITELVDELRRAEPVPAVAAAGALRTLFGSHLVKENEQLLPALVSATDVSVAALLAGMHELLGADAHQHAAPETASESAPTTAPTAGHSCGCGGHDEAGYPELDARAVPHAIRHATIFGALESVQPGGGMVLVAPHDPLPLLAQIEQRWPDEFEVSYTERGPEAWKLLFRR